MPGEGQSQDLNPDVRLWTQMSDSGPMLPSLCQAVSKVSTGSPWQRGSDPDALTNVVLGPLTTVLFFHILFPAWVTMGHGNQRLGGTRLLESSMWTEVRKRGVWERLQGDVAVIPVRDDLLLI